MTEEHGKLDLGDGISLAWAALPGRQPTVVFLGGLRSDMEGTKALFLRDRCSERQQSFLRLDYSGHGRSSGSFEAGTVGRWTEDAATIIEARALGTLMLIGSSLGGWIALLLARRWGVERVRGVVGIAAAPDFTEDLLPAELSTGDHQSLARDGVCYRPSAYGAALPVTARLLREGRDHLLLRGPLPYAGPVRLLHGKADSDVPWQHAQRVLDVLQDANGSFKLIDDGDHRLSRPEDLALIWREVVLVLGETGS